MIEVEIMTFVIKDTVLEKVINGGKIILVNITFNNISLIQCY